MNLKEFVSKTLIELTEAVIEAQSELGEKGAIVIPENLTDKSSPYTRDNSGYFSRQIQQVNFKVSVTAQENKEGKVGIGVVSALMLGAEKGSSSKNENLNTIEFSIPIALPEGKSK